MTQENQKKVDKINEKIDALKKTIKECYNNNERAKLDSEIKKCRAEIEAIKESERKPMKTVARLDDPTMLDRKSKPGNPVANNSGSIRKLGGGNFSVSL